MADPFRMDDKERQAKVSSLLHSTEASIKKGDLEDGLEKIRAVYAYDSRNLYAHAFEERIISLIATRAKKAEQSAEPPSPPEPSQPTTVTEKKSKSSAASKSDPADRATEMQKAIDLERAKWEEEKALIVDRERQKTKERLLETYRAFVTLMDVAIPKDQLDMLLLSLRGILEVTEEEHAEIIRSVQVNAYSDTLRSLWQKGRITPEEAEHLRQLCVVYNISEEEHLELSRQVKAKLGIVIRQGPILIVDDSRVIRVFIDYVLKKKYADIRTACSVHEAAEEVRKEVPALIICDVIMPEIGGFAFYEMVKRGDFGDDLKMVPFVFMSISSDDSTKKEAEALGVKTFLTKPFSRELLEQTVEEMLQIQL